MVATGVNKETGLMEYAAYDPSTQGTGQLTDAAEGKPIYIGGGGGGGVGAGAADGCAGADFASEDGRAAELGEAAGGVGAAGGGAGRGDVAAF